MFSQKFAFAYSSAFFLLLLFASTTSAQVYGLSSFPDTSSSGTHSSPFSSLAQISGTDLTGEERRITYSSDFHLGAVNGHWSGHSVDDDWDSSASTLASDRSVAAAAIAVGGVYFLAIF